MSTPAERGDTPRCPAVRTDLVCVELDGELVVYDERSRTLHHLNPTAMQVWTRCDGRQTAPDIARSIARAYSLDADDVLRDVTRLLAELRAAALFDDSDA